MSRDTEKASTGGIASQTRWLFVALFCVALVLGGVLYRGNMVTLPKHFQDHATSVTRLLDNVDLGVDFVVGTRKGATQTLGAVLLMAAAYLVSIAGQYLGGVVADKYDLRYGYLAFFALSIPTVAGMIFLTGWPLAAAAALFLVFNLGMQPIENSLIAKATPPRFRSTAYAVKFTLALGIGSVSVWIVGAALDVWQTSAAVYVVLLGVLAVVVVLQALMIVVTRRESMMNASPDVPSRDVEGAT